MITNRLFFITKLQYLIAACLIWSSAAFSQQAGSPLGTEVYRLDNGLTVYLNEDHSLPSIFGAVAVKGGSKRDPADATGIAHYFEHIMFKGTDSIGTLDYTAEKIYLDSIAALYDVLATTDPGETGERIQGEINRLSIRAAEYAIPNEFGKILGEMGGTNVNAGTSNDEILYFNIFPANQVEKWLRLYSHRFIHPVYRLFQSELETVYEEYNMYKDNRFANAFEEFIKEFYPNYPYGVPIVGYPDDLKNPSMRKMDEYFQTYYVANNMALTLSGNFNTDEVKPLISKYFGVWRSGEIPPMPSDYTIQPFKGRYLFQKKLTPVKFGIIAYRSVPVGHEDEPSLDVITGLLSNESMTGLLDKLSVDHKLMQAAASGMHFTEAGGEMIIFLPKIVGQSLSKAEELVSGQVDSLKAGRFSDELLEAVKTQIIVDYKHNFEDQYQRGYMMITSFVIDMDWQEILDYPERIKNITREDVITITSKYFGNDYLVCYSKTGFPKKPETLRQPFEHIPSVNTGMKSVFAQEIENMQTQATEPDFIEFGPPGSENNEVTVHDLTALTHVYFTENKVNDLFSLTIRFGTGTYERPVLDQLSEYMSLIGSEAMPLAELSVSLQGLGAAYYFNAGRDNFSITISGPDANLDTIVALVSGLLYHPQKDDDKIRKLYESAKTVVKVEKDDPETIGSALYNYAIFGDRSPYLHRLTPAEVRELKADTLLRLLQEVMCYEADIHYSGTVGLPQLEKILTSRLSIDNISIRSKSPIRNEFKEYDEPVVFFLDDKEAIQSKDYFFLPGEIVKGEDMPYLNAYADYLDGGMQSVIFQEIRELRSFAYASGASVFRPFYTDERSSLTAYVGTQADKTREAVEVMHRILTQQPDKSDRMEMVRKSLIQSINSNKPTFRGISYPVANYCKQNYSEDPRKRWTESYKDMRFDDIVGLYDRQFFHKPTVITIIGDENKIGTDWMKTYGKVIRVSKEDIFR
ncbi:MAG: insulinase family protein [Lentimicrobiaceae bacterium]|nr:insulinase family protein [Lentimicrobiaceae bacterium]